MNNRSTSNYLFTSDTHFSQQRTLELSRRPFSNLEDKGYYDEEVWCDDVAWYKR